LIFRHYKMRERERER